MIDIHTYKELHPESKISRMRLHSTLTTETLKSPTLPTTVCAYTFPSQITGYSLARKAWGE